jgi:hypothetical protein
VAGLARQQGLVDLIGLCWPIAELVEEVSVVVSGPATVVSSGEATTFQGHPLLVTFDLAEGPFVLEWVFEAGEEAAVLGEEIPGGRRFRCVALDDRPGRGTQSPSPVGQVGGDDLLVHFRVFRWGRTDDFTVHWTVFRVPRSA